MTEKQNEFPAKAWNGMTALLLNILFELLGIAAAAFGIAAILAERVAPGVVLTILGVAAGFVISPVLFAGLKVVRPNEALVLTLFGRYIGTVRGEGFYFVHPFASSVAPAHASAVSTGVVTANTAQALPKAIGSGFSALIPRKRISMKTMTLSNEKQKINDLLGNPIVIGIVVIWRVANTYMAVFNVENYQEFLSIQCDAALRNTVRLYPYDVNEQEAVTRHSLRGSSQEIAEKLRLEIQEKVDIAGLEILEARITHLAYAPEIAAAMLQRQQASAVVDARQLIVEGAVGMVEMALDKLNERGVVHLDEERKAAMVSNLLVVLCGNRDAQPIVNSGSIY
ncbi:MAG: SPFH domain-containing protein [Clostridia bacterium]|nr:SPFH domain-containing protein [Clostridia bacterium]